MGYGQYYFPWQVSFMGYCPHGKDWTPAGLYLTIARGTLMVKLVTKGKELCHEKRIDRFALYGFTIGNTPGNNVDHG